MALWTRCDPWMILSHLTIQWNDRTIIIDRSRRAACPPVTHPLHTAVFSRDPIFILVITKHPYAIHTITALTIRFLLSLRNRWSDLQRATVITRPIACSFPRSLSDDVDTIDLIIPPMTKMSYRHSGSPSDVTTTIMTLTNSRYIMAFSWPCHDSPWMPHDYHDPLMVDHGFPGSPHDCHDSYCPICSCSTHGQLYIPFGMFPLCFSFFYLSFIILPTVLSPFAFIHSSIYLIISLYLCAHQYLVFMLV
jgi:hypothetical protein